LKSACYPRASEIFADGADPLSTMIGDAERRLDQERAQQAKASAAKAADVSRGDNTRRARAVRRLGKMMKVVVRWA
jgi:hypothetical protein